MKIAIFDIDNTITFETEFMKQYAPVFLRKNGLKAELINESGYSLHEIYGLKEEFIKRGMSVQESSAKAEGMTNKFWNQYFLKYNRTKVRQGVTDVIRILRKYGYEINKVIINKDNKDLRTMLIDSLQLIIKNIGKWYFILKYKPIICGRNNIPKKGAVIFAGNHRNNLDPVFVTISSGKSIHWAALLRMFQGKESLFHSNSGRIRRELSAKFITAMGALPIVRLTDEDYQKINLKTIKQLKVLLNMKAAVGYFPEGTINRKPQETNILPLRSNRVFRMAKETNSYLQPFSIVWIPKELGLKNRLIIRYSKPINPYNRSSKEVGEMWQEAVEEDIQCSIELYSIKE